MATMASMSKVSRPSLTSKTRTPSKKKVFPMYEDSIKDSSAKDSGQDSISVMALVTRGSTNGVLVYLRLHSMLFKPLVNLSFAFT